MELDTTLYSFVISGDPNHANYTREDGVWVYYVGDIMKIRNYPESQKLTVTKRFAGNVNITEEQKQNISFIVMKVDAQGNEVTGENAYKKTIPYASMTYGKYSIDNSTADDNGKTTFGEGFYKVTEVNASALQLGLPLNVVASTTYSVTANGNTVIEDSVVTTDSITGNTSAQVGSNKSANVVFTNTYTTGAYYFNKIDAGTDQPIKGAKFGVFAADVDYTQPSAHPVTTYETGSDGKFSIKRSGDDFSVLAEDTLYYVVETEAAEGYEVPDPAPKYYFYFGTEGATAPSGAQEHNAVNLGEGSVTQDVYNGSNTDITVMKDWKNSSGNKLSDEELRNLSADVTLKRTISHMNKKTVTVNLINGETTYGTKTVTVPSTGTVDITFKGKWGVTIAIGSETKELQNEDWVYSTSVNAGTIDIVSSANYYGWDDITIGHSDEFTYADPVEDSEFSKQATLNYTNDFMKTWNKLDKTDADGNKFAYYVAAMSHTVTTTELRAEP